MDNLDDSQISDPAHSYNCSNNSQLRSYSSKSTNSISRGYGGNPSTSGYSKNEIKHSKIGVEHKEKKKSQKKYLKIEIKPADVQNQTEIVTLQPAKEFKQPKKEEVDEALMSTSSGSHARKGVASIGICTSARTNYNEEKSFSTVISLRDGIVMCATTSITNVLGYPKDLWIGRSFLNFVHEKDRKIIVTHIKNGFIMPSIPDGMYVNDTAMSTNAMCRLRRYRGLTTGFGVRKRLVNFTPFLLKFSFKELKKLDESVTYLVLRASPFISAFKIPYQVLSDAVPFVIRHTADGSIEYVDLEAVSYLGFVPHELQERNVLHLYHPHDLDHLLSVYETIATEGSAPRSSPYRMLIQNGCYIKLETEWSCFISPWSKKLECVIAKHHVIEGPKNPDVFQTADLSSTIKLSIEDIIRSQLLRDNIVQIMNEMVRKTAKITKLQSRNRCKDLAALFETLMDEKPKPKKKYTRLSTVTTNGTPKY